MFKYYYEHQTIIKIALKAGVECLLQAGKDVQLFSAVEEINFLNEDYHAGGAKSWFRQYGMERA
jgi:hypothetical protein